MATVNVLREELGRAIEAIDEAVFWARQDGGVDSQIELARPLTTKAILLSDVGKHDEALTCVTEAVTIRRGLAQSDAVYGSVLSRSLNVQATILIRQATRAGVESSNRLSQEHGCAPTFWDMAETTDLKTPDPEIELIERAIHVIGFPHVFEWMQTKVPSLEGRTPYSLMGSEQGRKEVAATLGRIEHGIF